MINLPDLCDCNLFKLWYVTDSGIRVCWCGHGNFDHIEDRMCVGEIEVKIGIQQAGTQEVQQ